MTEPDGPMGRGDPAPEGHIDARDGAAEFELDPTVPPDLVATEAAWNRDTEPIISDPKKEQERFREEAGVKVASSYVRSAEGPSRFPGLRVNGNGRLSDVAKAALRVSDRAARAPKKS